LRQVRIVPVIVIEDLSTAVPLANALVKSGLTSLEVTLRTDVASEAIRQIARDVPGALVGAGTVLNRRDVVKSKEAGAKFIVSPGLTREVVSAAAEHDIPILPGVATASDIMRGIDLGLSLFKFFPAENVGGASALKALNGPFPQIRFCPTGGITANNLANYLKLPNVVAAGGSWMVAGELVKARDYSRIEALASEAFLLAKSIQ
jgi:2-dehydro-3-deoxyphosphogluconate aldolase/(4S)-4-hydroxy-2-oxoglutarate aldolase